MKNKARDLFLVDDHLPFREGLKYVLSQQENLNIIGEASNGNEFLEKISHYSPDVVLMDIAMPVMNGIEATQEARKRCPDIKIIALSMFSEDKYYYEMLRAGAKGFVLKEDEVEELIHAINCVADNGLYINNKSRNSIIRSYNSDSTSQLQAIRLPGLSPDEQEVLELSCSGLSYEQISAHTGRSTEQVRLIKQRLFDKTGTSDPLSLILFAIRNRYLREE